MLKLPYTTNKEFVRYPMSVDKILSVFSTACAKYFGQIPYIMLQPCMQNRKENKVVTVNGKALYISENKTKAGSQYSFPPHHSNLFTFAEHAVRELKIADPSFHADGLVRVDVFQNQVGELIVNEFESLEAYYHSSAIIGMTEEASVTEWLTEFWRLKLKMFIPL